MSLSPEPGSFVRRFMPMTGNSTDSDMATNVMEPESSIPRPPPASTGRPQSSHPSLYYSLMKEEENRHRQRVAEIRHIHEGVKEKTERNMIAIYQLPEFQKHAIPMRNFLFNKILVAYAQHKQIAGYPVDRNLVDQIRAQIHQDEQNLDRCRSTVTDTRVEIRQLAWDYLLGRAKEEAKKLWIQVRKTPNLLKAVDMMLVDLTALELPNLEDILNETQPVMWTPPPPMY